MRGSVPVRSPGSEEASERHDKSPPEARGVEGRPWLTPSFMSGERTVLNSLRGAEMLKLQNVWCTVLLGVSASWSAAQSSYQVVNVDDGGTITGTVKWTGPVPKMAPIPRP